MRFGCPLSYYVGSTGAWHEYMQECWYFEREHFKLTHSLGSKNWLLSTLWCLLLAQKWQWNSCFEVKLSPVHEDCWNEAVTVTTGRPLNSFWLQNANGNVLKKIRISINVEFLTKQDCIVRFINFSCLGDE